MPTWGAQRLDPAARASWVVRVYPAHLAQLLQSLRLVLLQSRISRQWRVGSGEVRRRFIRPPEGKEALGQLLVHIAVFFARISSLDRQLLLQRKGVFR